MIEKVSELLQNWLTVSSNPVDKKKIKDYLYKKHNPFFELNNMIYDLTNKEHDFFFRLRNMIYVFVIIIVFLMWANLHTGRVINYSNLGNLD